MRQLWVGLLCFVLRHRLFYRFVDGSPYNPKPHRHYPRGACDNQFYQVCARCSRCVTVVVSDEEEET